MSTVNAAPAEKKSAGLLATLANNSKQYGIVGALVVIVLVFEFLTKGVLLKPNSFVSLIQQNAYVIILAIGMVMVIIATHIDLSVGSIVAFVGGVCAILMERQGVNWMLAILISLVVGLIIGCWQGFWVAYVGIPGFIMSATNALVQATCNATLRQYGNDLHIGIMTVVNSMREIFSLPSHCLSHAAQPVISYNYGAKQFRRVRSGISFMSLLGVILMIVCWILILSFPKPLLSLFTNNQQLIQTGGRAMQIYFFGFFMMSLQFAGQSTFVALGKSRQAVFFSLLRKVLIVFPLTLWLPTVGNLGTDGVFLAEPISNFVGGAACFITMMLTVWPQLKQQERLQQH